MVLYGLAIFMVWQSAWVIALRLSLVLALGFKLVFLLKDRLPHPSLHRLVFIHSGHWVLYTQKDPEVSYDAMEIVLNWSVLMVLRFSRQPTLAKKPKNFSRRIVIFTDQLTLDESRRLQLLGAFLRT